MEAPGPVTIPGPVPYRSSGRTPTPLQGVMSPGTTVRMCSCPATSSPRTAERPRARPATTPCSARREPARSVDLAARDDQTLLCEIRAYQAHLETAITPRSAAAG